MGQKITRNCVTVLSLIHIMDRINNKEEKNKSAGPYMYEK